MKLNEEIRKRIIDDAKFSLDLAYLISNVSGEILKQHTLESQARRNANILLLPSYIEAYKKLGYDDEEIIEKKRQ